ncbi:MAG: ABC1 kinase family protein, partial [Propioniciclava sp.]
MDLFNLFLLVVSGAVNAAVNAWIVRRILGVPVGWPRTVIVCVVGTLAVPLVVNGLISAAGVPVLTGGEVSLEDYGLLAVSGLAVAWVLALEIVILTVLELLVPTGSVPGPIELVRGLPAARRRSRRFTGILMIATRHGLGGYVRRFASPTRVRRVDAVAVQVRKALTEAGVTFVKLGQTLATRPDLLPEPFIRELGTLHSDVGPQPWEQIEPVIEAELGRPLAEVFASIDPEPLAAASVAQVHAGRLLSGEEVVVKVQRVAAREQVSADLDIVLRLADLLEARTTWGHRMGARALAEGFAASLTDELDYRVEVANTAAIGRQGGLGVPRVWRELSTPRMIVMERLAGQPISRATASLGALSLEQRSALAQHLFDAVLHQIVAVGVFHADLHPGNIVLVATAEGPRLRLLDFGSVGRLDRSTRESLAVLLAALDREDSLAAADAAIEVMGRPPQLDDRAFERDLGSLILSADGSALFEKLLSLVVEHGFSVPPMVAAAFRSIVTLEGSLLILDPDFDLMAAARRAGKQLKAEMVAPAEIRSRVEEQLGAMLPMLQRLPRRIDRITAELEAGRFTVGVRGLVDAGDRGFVTGLVQQATSALLCVALAV